MTLSEHLRELRSRIFKSAIAVLVGGVVGFVFRDQILEYFADLLKNATEETGQEAELNLPNITDSLVIPMQIALVTGIIIGAPVWIYQLWQFVTPGLYRNERKWARIVVAAAAPLFLAGVGVAFWVLPKAAIFLFNFQPDFVVNYVQLDNFIKFVLRMVLVFGVAFLLPIFVVLLNAAGILMGETLANVRRWVITGIFVFGAMATPTGDPITLMVLALPMWALFEIAVLICKSNDKRRGIAYGRNLADDEATPDDVLDKLGRFGSDDDDGDRKK